jgi:dihydrofolate reductase
MPKVEIHGYAIVSDNDCIADASGRTPEVLRNDADWAYFQAELNRSALTVLGRLGHEANPNPRNRLRMILSSSSTGLERRSDGWWWNPQTLPWGEAIEAVLPEGGRIAVPGGRQVFDLFLEIGYDAFHLTRAEGILIPGGVPVFSRCIGERSVEDVLADRGLRAGARQILDTSGPVSLVVWRPRS